jgi:RecB family exonuclease
MGNGVTAWSYSRYADYQQCPLKFKLKHIDKMKEPGSPAMQRGSDIHKEGENFLKAAPKGKKVPAVPPAYKHFADAMKELHTLDPMVEQQWGFTADWTPTGWFGADTWLRIVCDVVVLYDDHTVDLIDFKTGKKYDTNQDQMDLFSTAPFMKFPEVEEVTTRLWYLDVPDPDNVVAQTFKRSDFERIRKEWMDRIQPMFKDKRFAPKPNNRCGWCAFSKAKGGPCKF